jgi:CRISPR/Cas system-associated exonuclease Cas4 (RecB family)
MVFAETKIRGQLAAGYAAFSLAISLPKERFCMNLQRLSQGHLKTLQECPRKFEYIYLSSLASLSPTDRQQSMQFGSDFHRLLHQRELGMPIEPFLAANPKIQTAVHGLQQTAPHLFAENPEIERASEQVRTLMITGADPENQYLFTAIYDLLLLGVQAQIIDWKTHSRPARAEKLEQEWQTRLYLYMLVATSDYVPGDVSFTYWFVQSNPPQSVTFGYSDRQYQETQQELEELIDRLSSWLKQYRQGKSLPQVEPEKQLCKNCQFVARCDRVEDVDNVEILSLSRLDIAAIPEIAV